MEVLIERKIVLKQDILEALSYVGICKDQTVMVHTSLSSLGFVCGGAQVMIEALLEAVGDEGTIMMPAQSWKTAGGCGNSMKRSMWTAKILMRLAGLLNVSAMLKKQILETVRSH